MKSFLNKSITDTGKLILPKSVTRFIQDVKISRFKKASLEDTFTHIYTNRLWGTSEDEFYSGSGSDKETTHPYIEAVAEFINSNRITSLVDIGCGDFRVGNTLLGNLSTPIKYTGLDIVESLVLHNRKKYGTASITFQCVNAVDQDLPKAEACTIREVLQHLSNQEIAVILEKVRKTYKFAIITERQLLRTSSIIPNLDKVHGPHTRIMHNSSVYLDEPPFNLPLDVLLDYKVGALNRYGEEITTVLKTYLWKATHD
ncbi:class I SAM-dependent methyltransferase [Fibrella sp. ES10-3-2-2]|nr:hypothetical protein A6C57_05875 [Fibrella sp. ES10-3-2-2]